MTTPAPRKQLTVGDLFCGAGGFAEGFRQAGFKIAWGVDFWEQATDTFGRNFPASESITADVRELDAKELGHVDVLIGSPPCVHFSPANRGGSGDREAGMELVSRFLEIVRELSPRYWVMENVPALLPDLKDRMKGEVFSEAGVRIRIPRLSVIDASVHGTPQVRRRLFSGSFPDVVSSPPSRTEAVTLGAILNALPDPAIEAADRPASIRDPLYESPALPTAKLRDHFEDVRWSLTETEVAATEEKRLRDRIYGAMSFPDDLDRPARTVTATRTRSSRGTFVVPHLLGKAGKYRTLTVRECASIQGFPLTYQFWSDSMSGKDFLVGNAVPPPVARAIAGSILQAEAVDPPPRPILSSPAELPPIMEYSRSRGKRFSMRRRFRGSLPLDWRRDHRVELDNELPVIRSSLPEDAMPEVTWRCRAYLGYAELYRCYEIRFATAIALAREVINDSNTGLSSDLLSRALLPIVTHGVNGFPDRFELQRVWSEWTSEAIGPQAILSLVAREVGHTFPASTWHRRIVPTRLTASLLEGCVVAEGIRARSGQPLGISIRLFVGALSLAILCERINNGSSNLELLHKALASGAGLESRALDPMAHAAPRPSVPMRKQLALPEQ